MRTFFKRLFITVTFALILSIIGCAAPTAEFLVKDYPQKKPKKVAVLPLSNETTDMDAPPLLRKLMNRELEKNGYEPVEIENIDELLKEQGITEGGQLGAISNDQLKSNIAADAVMYGNVLSFKHLITGIYNERKVETNFKLVDLNTGEKLWEDDAKVTKRQIAMSLNAAKNALISNVANRVLEKWSNSPLLPESQEVVAMHLGTLPWGANRKGYPSWMWGNPEYKIGAGINYGLPTLIGLQLNFWKQKLGVQAYWSLFTTSANILYAFNQKKSMKYYVGVRLGYDEINSGIYDTEKGFGFSALAGFEWLRWSYKGIPMINNTSLSVTGGLTLAGRKGILLMISNGYYFK